MALPPEAFFEPVANTQKWIDTGRHQVHYLVETMLRIFFLFGVVVLGTHCVVPANAIEIQNFRSGLECADVLETDEVKATIRWICFETETIYVTGQGSCDWGGDEVRCTWYGFEFDYTNAKEGDEISCKSTSTLPHTEGNYEGVRHEDVESTEWSFSLEPGDGRFYNPQYSISNMRKDHQMVNSIETICFANNEEIFRYRFVTIFPSIDYETFRHSVERSSPQPK